MTFWIVVDLCAAVLLGTGFWMVFGVFYVAKSDPPLCSNFFGHGVPCGLQQPLVVVRYVVTAVLWFALVAFHARQPRHSPRSSPNE
jgi:hypothetical protein